MDLYKWAYKCAPLSPSELVADCFALARDIRALDMRASPYDLADLGYPPVRGGDAGGTRRVRRRAACIRRARRGIAAAPDRRTRTRAGAAGYFRTLTARATTRATVSSEIPDCSIIVIFAHRDSGSVSVGLNAVAFVNDR